MSENRVLVSKEAVYNSYRDITKGIANCQPLEDMGLLPLTIDSLATPQGKSFLHLTTNTYLSGAIDSGYCPRVSGKRDHLEWLKANRFNDLGIEFEIYGLNPTVRPLEHSGALGRLMYQMGIPKSEGGKNRKSKTEIAAPLPHYFMDIVEMEPVNDSARLEALDTITRWIFANKLYQMNTNGRRTAEFALQPNTRRTPEAAREHAKEYFTFLNKTLRRKHGESFLSEAQIRIVKGKGTHPRYKAHIPLNNEQIGFLTRHSPRMFSVLVNY